MLALSDVIRDNSASSSQPVININWWIIKFYDLTVHCVIVNCTVNINSELGYIWPKWPECPGDHLSLYIITIIIIDYTGQYNTIIKLWLFCHNVYIVISYTWFIGIVFIETIRLGPGGKQIKLFIVQINSDKHQLCRKC